MTRPSSWASSTPSRQCFQPFGSVVPARFQPTWPPGLRTRPYSPDMAPVNWRFFQSALKGRKFDYFHDLSVAVQGCCRVSSGLVPGRLWKVVTSTPKVHRHIRTVTTLTKPNPTSPKWLCFRCRKKLLCIRFPRPMTALYRGRLICCKVLKFDVCLQYRCFSVVKVCLLSF